MMNQIADTPPTLADLAHRKFGELTEAELKLVRALPHGTEVHCGDPAKDFGDPANDPKWADAWGREREIRATLIRWLCVDQDARQRIDPEGIKIWCARVNGSLNLSFVSLTIPLILFRCRIAEKIDLTYADVVLVALIGSHVHTVHAGGLRARGDILVGNGFTADAGVDLMDSEIGGNIDFSGSEIRGTSYALAADRVRVNGSVFFKDHFRGDGGVSLSGAQICGNLECDACTLAGAIENGPHGGPARGTALQLVGAHVEGSVFLRDGFSAKGAVNAMGAKIDGTFDCGGGSFFGDVPILPDGTRTVGIAIGAGGAKIGDSVYLRDGFQAEGEVRLLGTEIAGNLVLADATFRGSLLNAQRATVKGILVCTGLKIKDTFFNLGGSSADALVDDQEGWPEPGKLYLDGFVYRRFLNSPTDAKTRLDWLRLQLQPKQKGRESGFRPQPYQQLAKVLREQGDDEEARKVLIALEDDRRTYGGLGLLNRWWAWILKCTIGYGYRPMRALWFIGAFVALGFVVFGSAYQAGELVPSDKRAFEDRANQRAMPYYEGFCAVAYAVDAFVPIVDLGQRSKWKPIETGYTPARPASCDSSDSLDCIVCQAAMFANGPSLAPGLVRSFRWMDIVAGWFFTSLLVAGVTRLVRSN
jgi:hypothetical protein